MPSDDVEEDWQVDVVLRASNHGDRQGEVVVAVNRAMPEARKPAQPTYSFDMDPPDGSIGVSCWVAAASAGRAMDRALDLVRSAASEVTGEDLPVWDLRAVPLSAVLEDETNKGPSRTLLWRRSRTK